MGDQFCCGETPITDRNSDGGITSVFVLCYLPVG